MGDYVAAIRRFGTIDSYSTQLVSVSCDIGCILIDDLDCRVSWLIAWSSNYMVLQTREATKIKSVDTIDGDDSLLLRMQRRKPSGQKKQRRRKTLLPVVQPLQHILTMLDLARERFQRRLMFLGKRIILCLIEKTIPSILLHFFKITCWILPKRYLAFVIGFPFCTDTDAATRTSYPNSKTIYSAVCARILTMGTMSFQMRSDATSSLQTRRYMQSKPSVSTTQHTTFVEIKML